MPLTMPPDTPAVAPSPSAERPLKARLARLWAYFRQYRIGWVMAVAGTLIGGLSEATIPALLKPLLDEGFTQRTLPVWAPGVVIVGLFGLRAMANFASQYALARIANDGMVLLRRQLFARLLDADLALFASQSASRLANTIVYEVQNGSAMLVQAMLTAARDAVTVAGLMAYLLYLNWQLTLIVLVLAPVVAYIMKVMSRLLYRVTQQSQAATDALAYVVEENVLAHRMVRLHGAQAAQAARFESLSLQLRRLALKATRAAAGTTPLTHLVSAVALSLVIGIALSQGQQGQSSAASNVTVGGFIAFIGAMLMLIAPVRRLSEVVHPITRSLAALERGLDLLDSVPPEAAPAAPITPPPRVRGEVTLQNVRVAYPDAEAPALAGISLHIEAGQTVALVGPSGAGKTTLVNLLPRFVVPSAGQVLLDGTDTARWPLQHLRAQFSLVSQDVVMFNDTVAANVALGDASPDRARIEQALRDANLIEHVATLAQGMDTVLGHNATQLSGGQRQRLAIARALYKNAPVLLLDEATSALDTESERLVQQAIAHAMKGRTTFVIAHRLSTVEHADRILVMERGQIVEDGNHASLLAAGGLYARLHSSSQL